ncbi:MAG: pseudouridine synthase [Alistipes sp.]|jgi:23S rRNA pseudouridine2605 synthase|nr:pseudouridine synthase [Alistipes sp.]
MRDSDFKPQEDGAEQFQKDKRRRRTVVAEPVTRSPRAERTPGEGEQSERPAHESRPERPAYQPREHRPDQRPDTGFRPPREDYKPREYQPRGDYGSRPQGEGRPQGEYRPRGEYGADRPQRDYGRPHGEYGDRPQRPHGEAPRRSYNPNFSADNKFIGGPGQSSGERPERDFNRWDANPGGERKSYGERQAEGRPSYGDRPSYGERRPYTPRPAGERTPYGEKRPYTPRPAGDRPAYGERKQYGDRPAYGDKKPYGAGKPYGAKKPFGKKPFVKPGEGGLNPGVKPEFYPSYASTTDAEKEFRLNRYIAMCGKCSRREADEYIVKGEVTVNGEPEVRLGVKIKPGDEIRLRGELLSNERKVYIIMNKPKGFVTSVDDPHAEKTVMDIVRNACSERIYPVGRLDKSSVGVLLLTNDGDLTEKLTHPSHNKRKVYQVTLERPLTNMDLQKARDGIDLDDGVIIPDAVDFVKPDNRKEIGIEIHSGRNRIVRRIFEELGYGVHKLDRVYFCGLTKKNLKRGQWRFLTDRELAMLRSGRYE